MDSRPDTLKPFCDCTSSDQCQYGLTDRHFEMCRGTGPQRQREKYRDLVRGDRQPKFNLPVAADQDDDENLTPEEIDARFGCSACGNGH